jgi:peptide/nickel transport system permease protein
MVFTFVVAIPIGIYAALHKYSAGDLVLTVIGYIGVATPGFLLALILMFGAYKYLGLSVGGLFSQHYMEAPWSVGKVLDLFAHLWIPVIILGTAGTASLIRVMRGMLLDELRKQYVVTARSKGVEEGRLIFKYPVRIALNPIVSTIGWRLTSIVSGAPIVDVVLNLPTSGPLMLRSLLSQDMYLAGAFILLLCLLTVVGSFVSDLLLAMMDPRIRMEA